MASVASDIKIPGLAGAAEAQGGKSKKTKKPKEPGRGGLFSSARREKPEGEGQGLPFIGRLGFQTQLQILGILVLLFLSMMVAAFGLTIWEGRVNRVQTTAATELKMLSQRLAILALGRR